MAVMMNGMRWTDRVITQFFPLYPDREKASEVRARLGREYKAVFSTPTWTGWMKINIQEGRLIRLPGARFARPRNAEDLVHHVAPFTKREATKK